MDFLLAEVLCSVDLFDCSNVSLQHIGMLLLQEMRDAGKKRSKENKEILNELKGLRKQLFVAETLIGNGEIPTDLSVQSEAKLDAKTPPDAKKNNVSTEVQSNKSVTADSKSGQSEWTASERANWSCKSSVESSGAFCASPNFISNSKNVKKTSNDPINFIEKKCSPSITQQRPQKYQEKTKDGKKEVSKRQDDILLNLAGEKYLNTSANTLSQSSSVRHSEASVISEHKKSNNLKPSHKVASLHQVSSGDCKEKVDCSRSEKTTPVFPHMLDLAKQHGKVDTQSPKLYPKNKQKSNGVQRRHNYDTPQAPQEIEYVGSYTKKKRSHSDSSHSQEHLKYEKRFKSPAYVQAHGNNAVRGFSQNRSAAQFVCKLCPTSKSSSCFDGCKEHLIEFHKITSQNINAFMKEV